MLFIVFCTSSCRDGVLCCIIFLVADHRTTSMTLSRIWCVGQTLCKSQAVLALLSHPKREPSQQNVPCLLRWYARCPISWWCPFPEGGWIPMACCLPLACSSLRDFCWSLLVCFRSLVEEELTYWALLVNLHNLQNELMDVHQSDISKMLLFSSSNLVSFMFIKSHHFTWAYHVLLHKTSTPLVSFSSDFRIPVAERAHLLFLRGKTIRGIITTLL